MNLEIKTKNKKSKNLKIKEDFSLKMDQNFVYIGKSKINKKNILFIKIFDNSLNKEIKNFILNEEKIKKDFGSFAKFYNDNEISKQSFYLIKNKGLTNKSKFYFKIKKYLTLNEEQK